MQIGKYLRKQRRHRAGHQAGRGLEHGDMLAEHARDRRDLEADETAADDHHGLGAGQGAADRHGVLDAAQSQHAGKIAPRDRQAPRAAAGREGQPRIGQDLAVGEVHRLIGAVDRRHGDARHEGDILAGNRLGRTQGQSRRVHLAEQHGFRQRRPLIGRMRLAADQRDGAVIVLGAQRLGDLQAGLAGADDHDSRRHRSALGLGDADDQAFERRRGRDPAAQAAVGAKFGGNAVEHQ